MLVEVIPVTAAAPVTPAGIVSAPYRRLKNDFGL